MVIAGLYALTPLKRASEARCRELCAVHGPLPFNLMRSAMVAGGRYGLSCLGCSAGLMVATVLIGLSNLIWMIALTAVILIYKLAPAPRLPANRMINVPAMNSTPDIGNRIPIPIASSNGLPIAIVKAYPRKGTPRTDPIIPAE